MQFTAITLVLACAPGLMASPLMERTTTNTNVVTPNNYVEQFREPAKSSNGTLIYLGPPIDSTTTTRSEPNKIKDRASCLTTPPPTCSTSHSARNDICDQLVTELQGDATVSVPSSPRQICYLGSSDENAYCCVSWHNAVPSLTKGALYTYANTILSTCTSNGISGKTSNIKLVNTCTSVCLSNRGNGC